MNIALITIPHSGTHLVAGHFDLRVNKHHRHLLGNCMDHLIEFCAPRDIVYLTLRCPWKLCDSWHARINAGHVKKPDPERWLRRCCIGLELLPEFARKCPAPLSLIGLDTQTADIALDWESRPNAIDDKFRLPPAGWRPWVVRRISHAIPLIQPIYDRVNYRIPDECFP